MRNIQRDWQSIKSKPCLYICSQQLNEDIQLYMHVFACRVIICDFINYFHLSSSLFYEELFVKYSVLT